jgi:glycosyltransferase involved in cell wall biosynthesis
MYRNLKTAVVIPAYNEEKLIGRTVKSIPEYVDHIIIVNDASTDKTPEKIKQIVKINKKVILVDNKVNQGVGGSLMNGYEHALKDTKAGAIGIVAGDAQFDTSYLQPMLDELIDREYDYVKASRFFHREAFRKMPRYRQIGNIFISLLTKFSTGYYSITDITNGCGWLSRGILERVNFEFVEKRYDYETSMLTALSIAGAKIKDHAVPAHYGEETSTIKLIPTALRNLRAVWKGFWRRIFYKYVLFDFHPVALFLFGGLLLNIFGWIYVFYILFEKFIRHFSPSSGTVMLAVLPIILGFQMLLTAIIMDVNNENR